MSIQETCKERVRGELNGRINDLEKLWKAYQSGDEEVPDLGRFNEYGLWFDYVPPGTFRDQRRGYFRYQLSWGGPSDEFRFYCTEGFSLDRIEYWFLNWWDGAHITLRGRALWLLTEIFEDFRESGLVESAYQKAISDISTRPRGQIPLLRVVR